MKKMRLIPGIWMVILIILTTRFTSGAGISSGENTADTLKVVSYYGKVLDSSTGKVLPFANIEAMGSTIATISNIDGEFVIKVPNNLNVSSFKVSYLGFANKTIPKTDFTGNDPLNIRLNPSPIPLNQVTIRPMNATDIISLVLKKLAMNYSNQQMMMTAFYRETIKNRRNYVSISEAIVDVSKSSYSNNIQTDLVWINKGRKSANVEKMDTAIVKLQGGPVVSLLLDIAKNPYIVFEGNYQSQYDFNMGNIISINDKFHYVLYFQPKSYIDNPLFEGKLYIEIESLAITEAEFSLNLDNKEEAARFFIEKKPVGMTLTPEKAVYRCNYIIRDNKWYFNYSRAEVKFKVDWNKKLFNSYYTIMSEIAITDRENIAMKNLAKKDKFRQNDILDEKVYTFFDPNYWGDYNVIEPDQSIESAIRKLNRKFKAEL